MWRKSLRDNETEGTGLEPVRACAQRFSRPPPYQLGLALPTMLRLNLQRRGLSEGSRPFPVKRQAPPRRGRAREPQGDVEGESVGVGGGPVITKKKGRGRDRR